MLSNFTNDEFEEYLKRSSDSLRLRPSDKVWKGISKGLNERRRRIGFATGTFLLITSLLGYFVVQNKDSVQPATPVNSELNNSTDYTSAKPSQKISNNNIPVTEDKNVSASNKEEKQGSAIIRALYPNGIVEKADKEVIAEATVSNSITETEKVFETPFADSDPETEAIPQAIEKTTTDNNTDLSEKLLTIESVTNAYKRLSKKNKLSFQVFFTPTISYRKLTENKSYLRSVPQSNTSINYAVLYNVNDAVTHKPDIGLELGATAKYAIGKNLKLKGGLQFNVSRYAIKAFDYTTEYATIALNSGSGVSYTGSRSNHRNFGGGKTDWLQNMYFQVSAPIGAEIKLAGNENTSFGIATTVQPTYVLGDRAYLLSTDYKNYSEVPWLMRRWNVATNFETFVSYSTGKMRWQVGPQVRYQLLSSFVTEYPVKENLFDFGLKIGISLNGDKKTSEDK